MFVLFGFRTMSKTLAMITLVCGRCGNPSAHRIVQRSRWFTLFFIPVIPLGFTRYSTCTFCGVTVKISKEEAQRLIESAQQHAAAQAGQPLAPPTPMTPPMPQQVPPPVQHPETPSA